ncbi:hypothetical protein Cylst_4288 [Cylindrospermum stagnale PCC 7417]|uniref:Uncharacterized protein n=1 Tax=Cylindrospermum stagnale PCC 7417 TaxID=56107 RepID=K9X2S3_9NOST|nr:hypothetical protein [Cylindrospermum stagnale]AFZ26384.1 hypothetical protein Cylst_4288 [Cylindrospermum stagnale PCC 7417]
MKELYIFVTTDRPDQYLNPIVQCILRGITRIVFVQIEDSKIDQVQLNLLRSNVYDLIRNLSVGLYKYYSGNLKDTLFALDSEYSSDELAKLKAQYLPVLTDNIKWDIERIRYLDLRRNISLLHKKGRANIIFDVTSVSKVYIGDILACCLLENIDTVYTFELLVKPDFSKPWKLLIHDLEEGKQYRYLNLVETPIFKESSKDILIRTTPLIISIIGTALFVALTLAATFAFGNNSAITQVISTVGTALGITSFFLIYFPIRGK